VRRSSLRRRLGIALLLGYAAIVVLAAWRHEIRPSFLERPVVWARSLLALAGIPPGVAVFSTETEVLSDALIVSQCFEVRGVAGNAPARRIYPEGGRVCPAPSPRIWVRGEDIALYRFATGLRSAAASQPGESLFRSRERFARLLAETIGEHFRSRAEREFAPDRYALLWTELHVDYRSGEHSERVVALVRWRADPDEGVFVSWSPDDRTLGEHWPLLGEP
jgi:hypothetical protein